MKKTKKLLSAILAVVLLLSAMPMGVLNITASAATDGYYTYRVLNGEVNITECDIKISGDLVIPSTLGGYPVTSISSYAFEFCNSLESVIIPDSVISIGHGAFEYCKNLTSITLPDGIISIGTDAFNNTGYYNNSSNWENGVLYIGSYLIKAKKSLSGSCIIKSGTKFIATEAFADCTKLTKITLPNSVTCIDKGAFYNCSRITSLTIPNGVISIGSSAFSYCNKLSTVKIADSVKSIGAGAFESCKSLKNITLPVGITSIEESTFDCCRSLESIIIPEGVTKVGRSAFYWCESLKNVTIPVSIKSIGLIAFSVCDNLKEVYYRGSKSQKNKISLKNSDLLNVKWCYNICIGSATHTYDNGCDRTCNICKAKRDIEHSYKEVVISKATLKKNGKVSYKCTECGHIPSKIKIINKVTSFKLSTTSYNYNSETKTPNVVVKDSNGKKLKKNIDYTVTYQKGRKNVGTYKVTVKMKGKYSGTKTLSFKINLAKTKVLKITPLKKSLKVYVSKTSKNISGYQIQYSPTKNFKSYKNKTLSGYEKTSVTFTKLVSKKTYFVRVRTYKIINGKKYYSGWSTISYKKTK